MKSRLLSYKSRQLIIFIFIIAVVTYIGIYIVPVLYQNNYNKTASTYQRSRINVSGVDLTGMKSLTRSNTIYYDNSGPVPTNKVWSSAVFDGELTGLYTFPYASETKEGILNITVPIKYVYEKLIAAQIISDYISLKPETLVDKVFVKSYSDISVQLSFKDFNGKEIYEATYIQGSPYIFIKPTNGTFSISQSNYSISTRDGNYVFLKDNANFAIYTNASGSQSGDTVNYNFENGENNYLTIGMYTDDASYNSISKTAKNVIESVGASYKLVSDKVVISYNFVYANNSPEKKTIFGLLPNQYDNNGYDLSSSVFKINTLRGDQYFVETSDNLSFSINRVPLLDELTPKNLTEEDKVYLGNLIDQDTTDITYSRDSVYFGGNDLLKIARLLDIAKFIGREDQADILIAKLNGEFDNWFNYTAGESSKYFAFDESWGGVIGYDPGGFGGEKYNDHHFQYGYYIEAAAILSKYDTDFFNKYKDTINSLVLDIANSDKNDETFPYLRTFDAYEGHSWATGFGNVIDGNNQESTSEAINAWYAVWMWSKVTGDTELESTAEYLYSSEVNSARIYWLNWNDDTTIFSTGINRNKVSVVWGGKIEYQTFFSLEPQSIEGIQYLPITPGSVYLYNSEVIDRDYSYFKQYLNNSNANLTDFNYAYYAMNYSFDLLSKEKISSMKIDTGQSRANLYLWTKFWSEISSIAPVASDNGVSYVINYKE